VLIPVITVACTVLLKGVLGRRPDAAGPEAADPGRPVRSLRVRAHRRLRAYRGTPLQAVRQSRRLVDSIGWAAILPLMLAMLGGVFVAAKTGTSVQQVVSLFVNPDNRFLVVVIYCVGMALFTMVMGNARRLPGDERGHRAALPDPGASRRSGTAGGHRHVLGYCGTLMTPMAANYNIVPAALLELKNKYQVIKVQIPTALTLLTVNVFLMYFLAFR
jgi:uncharacterized membrane protein